MKKWILPVTLGLVSASGHAEEPRVDYSKLAFQPAAWERRALATQLVPWTGRQVVFLTPDGGLDPVVMRSWVEKLDAGWQLYAELTGQRPRLFKHIGGKATIAAVPYADLTCGLGCGYVGATGIEFAGFFTDHYPALQTRPKQIPHLVFYEMGRNFYTFGDRHSCFTTGFAVFMRYVCIDTLQLEDRDHATRKTIEGVEPLFSRCPASFLDLFTHLDVGEKVPRIKDANGRVITPSDQPVCYASAMLRLWKENGGNLWLSRFFRELARCPSFDRASREGALNQAWYWLIAAGVAAGKDLTPVFAGEWKLPLSARTQESLAAVPWGREGITAQEVAAMVRPEWR